MYLKFFGFTKEPFNITPDPEFLYLGPDHREALAAVIYGVEQQKGFVVITGEVGVGKTTILRSYLDMVDRKTLLPLYLFNPNLSFENLLKTVLRELGSECIPHELFEMVNQLHGRLIREYAQGRIVVLIIDEAQNMPVETLENLRLLSNLETAKGKLIQIVFSAQPEFEKLLERNELRQLKQRIAVKTTIRPLYKEESIMYIKHRLTKVRSDNSPVFSPPALRLIAQEAKGAPRMINILCDNSLITAYGYRQHVVPGTVVREVIADFAGRDRRARRWRPLLAAMSGIVISVGGLALNIDSLPGVTNRTLTMLESGWSLPLRTSPAPEAGRDEGRPSPGPMRAANNKTVDLEKNATITTVKKGDSLADLITEKYGYVSRELLEQVKRYNPFITDVNLITEGDKIVFPNQAAQNPGAGSPPVVK